MDRIATGWLPPTRVLHPYPEVRFAAITDRQEPSAVVPLAGICAGGDPKLQGEGSSLPRLKPAELCSCGPASACSQHHGAAASAGLVPGIVAVHAAHRTNRVSIRDAINQLPASRNLSQNQLIR
jgi:hypothetical protein